MTRHYQKTHGKSAKEAVIPKCDSGTLAVISNGGDGKMQIKTVSVGTNTEADAPLPGVICVKSDLEEIKSMLRTVSKKLSDLERIGEGECNSNSLTAPCFV